MSDHLRVIGRSEHDPRPDDIRTLVIGAGPAGLTAAYELARNGVAPLVLERGPIVGGIARTETYNDYRFDIGGHRFYTKVAEVSQLWQDVLGTEFRTVPRLSRIFYRGRFYNYPLDLLNTLRNLGALESALILISYLKAHLWPLPVEETFTQWVTNRFGARLFHAFFKTYTEKVWGISCDDIQADWAAQRIRGLSLPAAVANALRRGTTHTSLIEEFQYPVLGPGMMWERFGQAVERMGGRLELQSGVVSVCHSGGRVQSVLVEHNGHVVDLPVEQVVSSMPISELIERLDPQPPQDVLAAARDLRYRAFVLVGLIVDQPATFPDNWIYIHSPDVFVGRIQNFKNWSAEMVPHVGKTSLGMEYFCDEGDDIWTRGDDNLIALATAELAQLGLAHAHEVEDGVVIRQPKAYPVYDQHYRRNLDVVRGYLASITNLQTIGRNGMHRYNNQDHSMLTGLLAARNILGEAHDLWAVNTERSYFEEAAVRPERAGGRSQQQGSGKHAECSARRAGPSAGG